MKFNDGINSDPINFGFLHLDPVLTGQVMSHPLMYWFNTVIRRARYVHCTLQDKFTIPRPKFGTIEISGLNDL